MATPQKSPRETRSTLWGVARWIGPAAALIVAGYLAYLATGPHGIGREGKATLLGLPVKGAIQATGSDFRSLFFRVFELPEFMKLAAQKFSHDAYVKRFDEIKIDPSRLVMKGESEVRVYFVGEGAAALNSLGLNLAGVGAEEGNPFLLFPNVSTRFHLRSSARFAELLRFLWFGYGWRSEARPLKPGDFVDLGKLPAGTNLGFFLVYDGYAKNLDKRGPVFTAMPDKNPDQRAHMVAYAVEDSPYLLISFEDGPGGGDADFGDAVFAVEMSKENIGALLGRYDPWGYFKRVFWRVSLTVLFVGGPFFAFAMYRAIRRYRIHRSYAAARTHMAGAKPLEALQALDRVLPLLAWHERESWRKMTLAAAEQAGDLAHLLAVFEDDPRPFSSRENLALHVARALVEMGQTDDYAGLRGEWRKRGQQAQEWALLDMRAMLRQNRVREAIESFQQLQASPAQKAPALAEIAATFAPNAPDRARDLAGQALAAAAGNPDALYAVGAVMQGLSDADGANRYYAEALRLAPRDPFIRLHISDALSRHSRHAEAVKLLAAGLAPPSLDLLWTRFLFWSRVAVPANADTANIPVPPGPQSKLIPLLREVPPDRFWDAARSAKVLAQHPHLASRPEAWWLNLLEMLRVDNLTGARSALSLERSAEQSWQPDLETNLLRIVMFRQTGSLGFGATGTQEQSTVAGQVHPFFAGLDEAVRQGGAVFSEPMAAFLKGDFAFAAACLAVGWTEAGLKLYPHSAAPQEAPNWARAAFNEARRHNA